MQKPLGPSLLSFFPFLSVEQNSRSAQHSTNLLQHLKLYHTILSAPIFFRPAFLFGVVVMLSLSPLLAVLQPKPFAQNYASPAVLTLFSVLHPFK